MPQYKVTMTVEAPLPASVRKKLREVFSPNTPIHTTEKLTTPESRADRLSEAVSNLDGALADAKKTVQELRDEMSDWLDSMPANFRDEDKASEIRECIDDLQAIVEHLQNISVPSIENINFPSFLSLFRAGVQ